MDWWEDIKSLFSDTGDTKSSAKDSILNKDTWTSLGNIAKVATAIGTYQSNKQQQDQFNQLMNLKLDDYNRSVERQDTAQNNLDTASSNVFTTDSVDCNKNPEHPSCQILG